MSVVREGSLRFSALLRLLGRDIVVERIAKVDTG